VADERNPQQQAPDGDEVEDLDVPTDEAEDVKGGLTDFHFTKKIDKSSSLIAPDPFAAPSPVTRHLAGDAGDRTAAAGGRRCPHPGRW
jgi:hypothetical protein